MNNLELSNPVAWTDADELADMDCNTYGNIFNAKYIDIHNGRWLPLYSQGYIDSLIAQLEAANEKLSKPVVLPPRRSASSFVDEEFSNKDLAAIYNAARVEFSVKITNAGFTVEGG